MERKIEKLRRQMKLRALTTHGVRYDIGRKVLQLREKGRNEDANKLELLLTDESYIRIRLRRNFALQIADEAAVQMMTSFPEAYPDRSAP